MTGTRPSVVTPVHLALAGVALYGLIFALVFVERDHIFSYELVYGAFVLMGVVTAGMVVKRWSGAVVVLSLLAMAVGIFPLMFMAWVVVPQALILAGAVWQMRRAMATSTGAAPPSSL